MYFIEEVSIRDYQFSVTIYSSWYELQRYDFQLVI